MTHALVDTSLNARFTIRGSGQVSGNPFPAGHLRRGNEQPKASNEILAQRKIGGSLSFEGQSYATFSIAFPRFRVSAETPKKCKR